MMNTARILIDLIYHIEEKTTGMEEILVDMLRGAADKLGTNFIAELVTPKEPLGAKTDEFFLKWRNEKFIKEVKENEMRIKKIIE